MNRPVLAIIAFVSGCAGAELVGTAIAALTTERHGIEGGPNQVILEAPETDQPPHSWSNYAHANSTGANNLVMGTGWNLGPGNARADQSRHGAWYALESEFEASQASRFVEWHFQYFSSAGASRRPVSALVNIVDDKAIVGLQGKVNVISSSSAQVLTIEENGLVRIHNLSASSALYKQGNNTPIVLAQDTAGSAREVLRLDSANDLVLGKAVAGRLRVQCATKEPVGGASLEERVDALEAALVAIGVASVP